MELEITTSLGKTQRMLYILKLGNAKYMQQFLPKYIGKVVWNCLSKTILDISVMQLLLGKALMSCSMHMWL